MMFSTSQVVKFTVALGIVLIASSQSVFAQGSVYSRSTAKIPPVPGEVYSPVKPEPQAQTRSVTPPVAKRSNLKPGTRGLWGSNGELRLLPPVDGAGLSSKASSFVKNKKMPPLPTDTIKKPIARLAKSTSPSSRSSFISQAPKTQSTAKTIDWNQPSVIAGPLPSKWAVSQATAVKETKLATAPHPSAKIANVEEKIAPSHTAPTQSTSRYSVYRDAKIPQSVASKINQLPTDNPSPRAKSTPVSQAIPPMIKRPSNKRVFARISDEPVEENSESEYSPIMACRLLGLKAVNSDEVTERK